MKLVEGRTDSFMQVPDGRMFSPIIWTAIMRRILGVGQFKAIQERKDLIRILLVKNDEFNQRTIGQIGADVKDVMGEIYLLKQRLWRRYQRISPVRSEQRCRKLGLSGNL